MDRIALDRFFEEHREEMLADIAALIRIPSVRGESLPGKPYGEAPAQALHAAMQIAERLGFRTVSYENYAGAIDFGDLPAQLDILAHLDVVPAGDGWSVTRPFDPVLIDGALYGRGSSDDKGPAMAALYAMYAVKSLQVPLKRNVRLILGTDEECGSSDLEYYYSREPEAPMSFSPDADFPLINVEKGRFIPCFSAQWEDSEAMPRVCSFSAGVKVNMVPDTAQAVIEGLSKEQLEAACKQNAAQTGVRYTLAEENGAVLIMAKGTSAHASLPETGCNALTALLSLVCSLPLAECRMVDCLRAVSSCFPHGDFSGRAAGIAMKDAVSGALTASLNLLSCTRTGLSGQCDCRVPCCATEENCSRNFQRHFAEQGIETDPGVFWPAHQVPEDSPFVRTLLSCYEAVTGKKGKGAAIGGITYVHHLKNGVAFGCSFPSTDNRMHGDDEFVLVDELMTAAKIFALAIEALCK